MISDAPGGIENSKLRILRITHIYKTKIDDVMSYSKKRERYVDTISFKNDIVHIIWFFFRLLFTLLFQVKEIAINIYFLML